MNAASVGDRPDGLPSWFEPLLTRVRALAPDGPVDVPYECEIHVWRP